jgi:hypothetical protein
MKREWKDRLLILTISCLLGLLVLEATVRVIEPKEVLRTDFEGPDPQLNHRLIAGSRSLWKTPEFSVFYSINSLGLRDREISRAKPEGTGRVLMLGDSFTEGVGVEAADAFPARVQELVDHAGLKKRWEVINAGEASYSPILEYLLLKRVGLDLQPDLVILNLDLSDMYDDINYTKLAVFDAAGDPIAVRPEPERKRGPWYVETAYIIKDFVKDNTRAWNFLRRHITPFLIWNFGVRPDSSGDLRDDKYAEIRENYGGNYDQDFVLTYRYLEKIRDLLAARGIPLWVSVYPYGLQISGNEWDPGRRFWGFQLGKIYPTTPQEHIVRFCQSKRIPVINMIPDFQAHEPRDYPLYFQEDGHWLPAGHAIAAASIFKQLLPFLKGEEPQAQARALVAP